MPTYNIEVLQQAIEAHKSGKLQDAEVLYRKILQAQPKHPDANHNLGVLAVSVNKTGEWRWCTIRHCLYTNGSNQRFSA